MTLVCATHPDVEALARCVRCGLHLCDRCRSFEGVRNFCRNCHEQTHPQRTAGPMAAAHPTGVAASAALGSATAVASVAPQRRARSRWLAAVLSLVPGLGQAYAGRLGRGVLCFAGALLLRDAPFMTPLLGAYLYAFGLFDAFRCAEATTLSPAEAGKARGDDVAFLLAGLLAVVTAVVSRGGFATAPPDQLVPLAALATGLVIAHETRR